jgi:predicted RND superfamily exporter protein
MKANVGSADRTIRLILALTLIALFYTGILKGIIGILALIVALLLTFTSLMSFCPLYKLFNITTIFHKKRNKGNAKNQ